jgi:DNA mismatch endonuclease (patch repair protein)
MDRVSQQVRSKIMASVRSVNGSTEQKMATLLRNNKLPTFRMQWPVIGKPDFAWPKRKVALFIDGCFWHGCPRCNRPSKSNVEFWKTKVVANRRRDIRVARRLRRDGWKVLRVWECVVEETRTLSRIRRAVASGSTKCSSRKAMSHRKGKSSNAQRR